MANLRQKTWGLFIKPYIAYGGDYLVQRGGAFVTSPCQNPNNDCTEYSAINGGQIYMLHKTFTSFVELRQGIKEVMDELGYSKNDILVTEIIPIDHIITPLA